MNLVSMPATRIEYRFRVLIIVVLYVVALVAPWQWLFPEQNRGETWGVLIALVSRTHLLSFNSSFVLVNVLVLLCAFAGALLRWWATAYIGVRTSILDNTRTNVRTNIETRGSGAMLADAIVAEEMVASGPYRYLRNPLYLGSWLLAVPLAVLMRPSGAIFLMIALAIFLPRLAGAERAFLSAQPGEAHRNYRERVPAILPETGVNTLPRAGPDWLGAALVECYGLLIAGSFAAFCWSFNAQLLLRCAIISFGISLVVNAVFSSRRSH